MLTTSGILVVASLALGTESAIALALCRKTLTRHPRGLKRLPARAHP